MKLDILAFGVHPDDVELGAGGFLAAESARGRKCGIVDLTRGEMATNGTPEGRLQEAKAAGKILGLHVRENLGLKDRGLSQENVGLIAQTIRKYQPKVLLLPYWEDRHPDHRKGSHLVEEGAFNAGLSKYPILGEAWKSKALLYYQINSDHSPSFLVDISNFYPQKQAALSAHSSQFSVGAGQVKTRLNSGLLYFIESRDRLNGAKIGVEFAEGFILREPLVLPDPVGLLGGKI